MGSKFVILAAVIIGPVFSAWAGTTPEAKTARQNEVRKPAQTQAHGLVDACRNSIADAHGGGSGNRAEVFKAIEICKGQMKYTDQKLTDYLVNICGDLSDPNNGSAIRDYISICQLKAVDYVSSIQN